MSSPAHSLYFRETYSMIFILSSGLRSIIRTPSLKIRFIKVNGA